MKDQFFKYIHELQDTITSKLELIDGSAVFKEDIWKRPEGNDTAIVLRRRQVFRAVHSVAHTADYTRHLYHSPQIRYGKPPPEFLVIEKK